MRTEKFCEFEFIKKYFNPLTPYGKNFKENISIIVDKKLISRKYELIEAVRDIKKKNQLNYDMIKYHLKNIPYISHSKTFSDISDVFIVKKFINNYHAIYRILPSKIRNLIGFKWELDELFKNLNLDGVSDTFYISEKYDERLKILREKLISVIKEIDKITTDFKKEVKERFSIDMKGDFVVISSEKLTSDISDFFTADIYDSRKVILRPRYSKKYIEILSEREKIVSEIKKIESEVIEKIVGYINKDSNKIFECIKPLSELDIAVASYELCEKFNLKRPELGHSKIYVKNGVFLPLKNDLEKMNIDYIPLTFGFDKRINIIQGSNMGGKTVVLKTIVLIQYMAQCGFFVPADQYMAPIFEKISVALCEDEMKGLSSFAFEIYQMVDEIKKIPSGPILIITDEFAKTTNHCEATALINAIIDFFSENKNIYLFMATHFSGIKPRNSISFLKMKGFNRDKYSKFAGKMKDDIVDKIRFINKFMDYILVRVSDGNSVSSDAIEIAKIIGIPEKICENAKKYLEVFYEKNKKQPKNTDTESGNK